jgi:hypothetical protein
MSAPDYWDSQAVAAAELHVSIDRIRDAKRGGCQAFKSGRVYKAPLIEWLAARKQSRISKSGDVLRPLTAPEAERSFADITMYFVGLSVSAENIYPPDKLKMAKALTRKIMVDIGKLFDLVPESNGNTSAIWAGFLTRTDPQSRQ